MTTILIDEDKLKITELKRYAEMFSDLANGRITPRSVIGTGYTDGKKVAFQYISERILSHLQQLEENTNVS